MLDVSKAQLFRLCLELNKIYQRDPSFLCGTVTAFFHHVTQDKETRPIDTICSVNTRLS